jgi:hypothetical protein
MIDKQTVDRFHEQKVIATALVEHYPANRRIREGRIYFIDDRFMFAWTENEERLDSWAYIEHLKLIDDDILVLQTGDNPICQYRLAA